MKNFYLHIWFIFFSAGLFAQSSKSRFYLLENDEVNKPKILTLYQNSNGLILCGTTKGLYRFDGFDFTPYLSQKNNNTAVTAVFETKDKRTLVGFDNGTIAEVKFNTIQPLSFEEGFPKVAIKSIVQDSSGTVWFGAAGEGIYYIKNNRLYNINEDDGLSDNYVYKLLYFPQRGIIAATDRGINICSIQNGKNHISAYSSKNGLPDNIVRNIILTNDNSFWIGMQDAGIMQCTGNFNNILSYSKWNYGQVNDMLVASSKLYVATEDSALMVFEYDKQKKVISRINEDHTINKLSCLLKDREGNIWTAGDNQLLRTAKTGLQKVYSLTQNEAEQIHCLHYSADSALWFNIPGGLTRLYKLNNEWKHESFKLPSFSNTTITALYEDPGNNIWVGSLGKGITIFNHEKQAQYRLTEPLLANSNAITITGGGNVIWISGLEGVVRASLEDNKYIYTNFTDTAGIGNKYVYSILCDKQKHIWFGTDGDGVSMWNGTKFFHLKNQKGSAGKVIYKIVQDKFGNIWYATYSKGVIKYDGKDFTAFTTSQGLSDMAISGLVNAGDNIAVFHKNSIDIINPATNKISYVDKTLTSFDINTDLNACTNDKDGNIYFVSGNTIYSYAVDAATVQQPTVSIDRMQLFLKNTDVNKNRFNHNQNNLSFFYTGIYYSEPEKIQYEYKLDGYDKEWIPTKDRVKNFPNLPPGDYTFRIRVSLNQNFSNASEADYSFKIEKPFWLQTWFVAVALLMLGLLLYLFIRIREKHINNLNSLKNQKIQSQLETLRSQVNPHFLFNSLNTLVSEIETDPEEAVTYVERIADFYRNIIQHREKDIIPLSDELQILKDYIFLQEKRFASGLEINVDINQEIISSSYTPPLVLQLLVENATKHNIISKETPLCVEIKNIGEGYLTVRNNINKKLHPERRSGLGLQNIQRRYELLLNKKVTIENDGNFFIVKIPLIKKQNDQSFNTGR